MSDNMNLASEILAELKASAKRWFIAFCIMVILEICTIAGFLYYFNSQNNVDINNKEGYANYVGNDLIGELLNGTDTGNED